MILIKNYHINYTKNNKEKEKILKVFNYNQMLIKYYLKQKKYK